MDRSGGLRLGCGNGNVQEPEYQYQAAHPVRDVHRCAFGDDVQSRHREADRDRFRAEGTRRRPHPRDAARCLRCGIVPVGRNRGTARRRYPPRCGCRHGGGRGRARAHRNSRRRSPRGWRRSCPAGRRPRPQRSPRSTRRGRLRSASATIRTSASITPPTSTTCRPWPYRSSPPSSGSLAKWRA